MAAIQKNSQDEDRFPQSDVFFPIVDFALLCYNARGLSDFHDAGGKINSYAAGVIQPATGAENAWPKPTAVAT